MKKLRLALAALAIGVAGITSAQAHDSFSFGLNIGGYGYPPPVFYAPPVPYYNPPVVYYSAEPRYYSYPSVSYGYYNDGSRGCRRGGHRGGWGHDDGGRGGWDHDGDDRGEGHGWRH